MEKKNKSVAANLPIIKCLCGAEFLLLPDLKRMSLVVMEHAQLHKEAVGNSAQAEQTYSEIEDLLTSQILKKASQIG